MTKMSELVLEIISNFPNLFKLKNKQKKLLIYLQIIIEFF